MPAAWAPLETTTEEEATFLSPLDPVSARGRAKPLFGFDYIWEVYKPVEKRSFGYYTMPILWGDRLVGRFDPKLDRTTGTLVINGLWLEDDGARARTRRSARRWRPGWRGSCGCSALGGSTSRPCRSRHSAGGSPVVPVRDPASAPARRVAGDPAGGSSRSRSRGRAHGMMCRPRPMPRLWR